jgi:nucleoid DNA-binding protein
MSSLTKRDLCIRIAEESGLTQQECLAVVQKTLDYIIEALVSGKNVELRKFGVFEVRVRKARVGRNPNRPETDVPIPARAVVKFKAGKEMKAQVLALSSRMTAAPVATPPPTASKPATKSAAKSAPAPVPALAKPAAKKKAAKG